MNDNATSPIYLSIIIPSYKSALVLQKNVSLLLKYLGQQSYSYEVIVVDDGSNDNGLTESIAKKLNVSFLKNKKNLGKGGAVRYGMLNAKGKYLIFTDDDIPFEFTAFEKILHYLDFKEFDMAVGDRTLPESSYFKEIQVSRKIGSRIFSFIVGRFITGGWYDTQCGMKGFRAVIAKDIFERCKINGFAMDVEIFYLALKRNYDIKRLSVRLRSQEGKSVNMVKHGMFMFFDLLRILYYQFSGKYSKKQG